MINIQRLIANIIVIPIRNHEKRHKIRRAILDFHLKNIIYIFKFLFSSIRKNSVLLIEPNDCHGEVIVGYLKYFIDLGYTVDVLINSKIKNENPFCRLDMTNIHLFHSDSVKLMLKFKQLREYNHIVLMTSAYYKRGKNEPYPSFFTKCPKLKKHPSLFVVEHDLIDIKRFDEEDLLKKNRLLTLGHFSQGVFASPIRFGSLKITPKNDITTFITVGAINSVRKNHQILIDSIKSLAQQNLKFKVLVVGLGALENLPIEIHPYIEILGRLDFPKMFEVVEKADFFLPLLDPNSKEHERYITTGVTGSAQLIYAFSKVPVIHPKFAEFYGFDNSNALVIDDLEEGMKQAIEMNSLDYLEKQQELTNLANALKNETIENLKRIM